MTDRRRSISLNILRTAAALVGFIGLTALSALQADPAQVSAKQEARAIPVIIPNVDDDDGNGVPDFRDKVLNGAVEDDLLQIVVKPDVVVPMEAALEIEVAKPWAEHVRVLAADPADKMLRPVKGRTMLGPDALGTEGVRLAVEAGAFAGPGRTQEIGITFIFETSAGVPISRKEMKFTVAPFLMSCCLDPTDTVHVVRTRLTSRFADDLKPLVEAAGARLLAFEERALPEHDIWIQDATEIGYASDGHRTMRIALHGNRGLELDGLFAKAVLGKDSGVVHPGGYRGKSAEWIDWFGNLEVSPPLEAGGRAYPNGRIYAGTQGVRAMHPEVIAFLEAQGAQAPVLWLDTSWLVIGHVDETVSWVPSKVGKAFRMLVPSPRLALEILRQAEKDAPGCLLNRGTKREGDERGLFTEAPVTAVLNDAKLLADQEFVARKIEGVRRTLQTELGVADGDIIEIPVLFDTSPGRFAGRYGALTTNMVNSLLVGETFIVPDPHGPLVNGKDVLLQAVKDRLEPIGCKVVAVDNFYPYHAWAGEVHCGTNATRRPPSAR